MNRFSLLILFLLGTSHLKGQEFSAGSIAPDLKARASAVIRIERMNVKVSSLNEVDMIVRKVVTVLNSNGDREAALVLGYDKTTQIRSLKGLIYNELGLPVSKITEKNFSDQSAVSDFSLFEDSRVKQFQPGIKEYPYTVEYEYEIRLKQTLVLPEWDPAGPTGVSVENSTLSVQVHPDLQLRYKEFNIANALTDTDKDGFKQYKWAVSGIRAARYEPFSPRPHEFLPTVMLALDNFKYRDVTGSFLNWKEYGSWMNNVLLKNRGSISEQTAQHIRELVKDISDPKLKAKRIYEFVQQKTRYISVQIGIGGFQPMLASEVDRLSYGDCKGLVNYTQSLLNALGIESFYTIVQAGNQKEDAIADFASMNQFNHVILAIPFEKDTAWVDCTSKTLPFGYLGDFTDDRLVLAVTKSGGKILRTPKYTSGQNLQSRTGNLILDKNGSVKGEILTTFRGAQFSNRGQLIHEPLTEQLKKVVEYYPFEMKIQSFSLSEDKGTHPVTTEKLVFESNTMGALNNGRLYFRINALSSGASAPRAITQRNNPVYINRGYTDIDSITFMLPEGYIVDTRPRNVNFKNDFGEFTAELEIKEGRGSFKRFIHLKDGLFEADKYQGLVDFFSTVKQADQMQITLVPETNRGG